MPIRKVRSKLLKGIALKSHRGLRRYLPETHSYRPYRLKKMLRRHRTVFIKPDGGSQGKGIVRVRRMTRRTYKVSWDLRSQRVRRRYLKRAVGRKLNPYRRYVIQRGISLAKYHGRRIDIRVYMQKPSHHWLISGKVTRVGAPGRFVTNFSQGAYPERLTKVLHSLYSHQPHKVKSVLNRIDRISYRAAETLDRRYPGLRQLGIDIGLDRRGRIWIIEVNTNPGHSTFRNLKNKTMYHNIIRRKCIIHSRYAR
ncbi:YheC/YheD family protein [Paenibacillus sp. JX-17]|uniref:YheC/YheD family protein n=1 Tax=Paenibacillus lacisoli TaxID=3064525 RepID=A0ABT9CFA6_9BACL|nr:YheC/YheD family protein [Paenibacillus sp. JX-17]MDO7907253.1 YheC/YheD family protein [Paenibacillus sp. JX-17]